MKINLFPDPLFVYYIAKHSPAVYRPWKLTYEEMDRYRAKALRKIVRYAYGASLYQEKYKETNIHPDDIQSITDIHKLPFVTKQDLRDYGAAGTVPHNFNIEKSYKVDTSGSTGEPVSIYRDLNTVAIEFTMTARMLNTYNLSLLKTRITNIGDFSILNSYDEECLRTGAYKKMGFLSLSLSERRYNHFILVRILKK